MRELLRLCMFHKVSSMCQALHLARIDNWPQALCCISLCPTAGTRRWTRGSMGASGCPPLAVQYTSSHTASTDASKVSDSCQGALVQGSGFAECRGRG